MYSLTGPNIALYKMTEQYPGYIKRGTSYNAVNGNTTNSGLNNLCAQTDWNNTGATEAWWRVDLGDTFKLTGIKIYNRDRKRKLTYLYAIL